MPQKKLYEKCTECGGDGLVNVGEGTKTCPRCVGVGELEWGFWQDSNNKVLQKCTECNGVGTVLVSDGAGGTTTKTCPRCRGEQNLDWGRMEP